MLQFEHEKTVRPAKTIIVIVIVLCCFFFLPIGNFPQRVQNQRRRRLWAILAVCRRRCRRGPRIHHYVNYLFIIISKRCTGVHAYIYIYIWARNDTKQSVLSAQALNNLIKMTAIDREHVWCMNLISFFVISNVHILIHHTHFILYKYCLNDWALLIDCLSFLFTVLCALCSRTLKFSTCIMIITLMCNTSHIWMYIIIIYYSRLIDNNNIYIYTRIIFNQLIAYIVYDVLWFLWSPQLEEITFFFFFFQRMFQSNIPFSHAMQISGFPGIACITHSIWGDRWRKNLNKWYQLLACTAKIQHMLLQFIRIMSVQHDTW